MNPSSSGVSLASDCRESPGADLRGMNVVGLAGEKIFFTITRLQLADSSQKERLLKL